MYTQWSKPTRYIVGVGLVLFSVFVLYVSRQVIPLLIIAALIAIMVRPFVEWLHRRLRLPRGVAIALAYLVVSITVPLIVVLLVAAFAMTLQDILNVDYQGLLQRATAWGAATLTAVRRGRLPLASLDVYVDSAIDVLLGILRSTGPTTPPSLPTADTVIGSLRSTLTVTFGIVASVVGTVLSLVILYAFVIITSIYMSLSAHSYRQTILHSVPPHYQPELAILLDRIGHVWTAFLRGKSMLMLIIGLIVWLGLAALGVPGALSLGVVAGFLELLPSVGPTIATIPAVVVALLHGSTRLSISPLMLGALVVAFYAIVQQLENSLIVPRVLGKALDLPALVVITGVLVGSLIGGVVGAILATPIIATAREILRYLYLKLLGQDPFPPESNQPVQAEHSHSRLPQQV